MELNEDAKLVFDAMREGITIIDTQGHIVFGNRAYREFLSKEAGGDIGPIEGYALRDLRPGARLPDVLASGKPVLHITRKEIEDFYFVNMYPIYAQGELVGGVSVVTFLEDAYQARDELEAMARESLDAARKALCDLLCNYQGYRKCEVIAVFDAYKVRGGQGSVEKYHSIHVVYTKEAETADQYIEKVVHQIGRKYHVTVVTSDGVEQVITRGQGGTLISSREFRDEVELVRRQIREEYENRRESGKNYLFDHMDEKLQADMEDIRLGRKDAFIFK